MWMNEDEIREACDRYRAYPVLGQAARFLRAFMVEVNEHSDGWAYWPKPARAAARLMQLVHPLRLRRKMPDGSYGIPDATEAEYLKTLSPIKRFYTMYGKKAGMAFPPIVTPVPPLPVKLRAVKEFKVAAISSNRNSFGLTGVICVARDGVAFEVAAADVNVPAKGQVLKVYEGPSGAYDWSSHPFEIPTRIKDAPAALAAEIWKD